VRETVRGTIAAIRHDRTSGATALVLRGIDALIDAGEDRVEAARALCEAQPAMAGFRTAAALALAGTPANARLAELAGRIRRAPAAIARHTTEWLRLGARPGEALRIVTCSRSGLVEEAIARAAAGLSVAVTCAESRPGEEGTRLARALAGRGIDAAAITDAGIGTAIPGADAILLGADALAHDRFVNKAGSAALVALGSLHGVPVAVLAGAEKIVPPPVFTALTAALPGPTVAAGVLAPVFEWAPLSSVAVVVTSGGLVAAGDVEAASLWDAPLLAEYLSVFP
jgi:translation initiation factor 2B subunit (eIF-2B alpha/beta/delta family)